MAKTPSRRPSSRSKKPPQPPPTWDEQLIQRLIPYRVELGGVFLFLLGFITLIALPGWTESRLLTFWTNPLQQLLGWGAYPLALSFAAGGLHLMMRQMQRPYTIRAAQVIGFELLVLTSLPLSHQLLDASLADAFNKQGGGLVGWALSDPLNEFLGPLLTGFIYLLLLSWSIALMAGRGWNDFLDGLNRLSTRLQQLSEVIAPEPQTAVPPGPARPISNLDTGPLPPFSQQSPPPDELLIIGDTAVAAKPKRRRRDPRLPAIDVLLEGAVVNLSTAEIDDKKQRIEQTLADFGLPATVTEVRRGPAVTQFGVTPGYIEKPGPDGALKQHKVRVGQIAALQKDLTLALAVSRLRIEAPVPGRSVVGIEVPNAEINVVRLRSIIESETFYKLNKPLAVALGRDVSGLPIAVDLGKMPHLLIAGTTGSGKSVNINAMIACLVFNNTPEQLQLVMVDPKKVELIRFNGLPHLIGNVEVEADRAVGVLRWLTAEMDRRYELFTKINAKNLNSYNQKIGRKKEGKKLPNIVVFIDELADLMHMYPGDVERTLCRLAQMARATGIHLVVATQRPSTDVITGLIKANFPARLSFAVASGIDSRVILDSVGAEHLMGKGDMLFLGPEASSPHRVQGVFVNDMEVEGLVTHWQKVMPDFEPLPPPWDSLIARYALLDETDSMLEQAIELAQKQDFLSTSFLQRRLRVGYPRAARIMEHLFEMGLVEDPKAGGKTRKTYVDEGSDDPLADLISQRNTAENDDD